MLLEIKVALQLVEYKGTSMVFLSCHLAAHMGHLQDRLSNIREIFRNLRFGNPNIEMNSQFDYIFLLGDLNFRLDVNRISKKQGFPTTFCFDYVINQIEKKNFKELFQYDQLHNCQMEEGHLSGFKEGTYNFAPTFKVLKDVFGMEYNKKRIPSYCDRILWKSIHSNDDDNIEKEDRSRSDSAKMIRKTMSIVRMEEEEEEEDSSNNNIDGGGIKQLLFESCEHVTSSDHKPVRSLFNVNIFKKNKKTGSKRRLNS